MLKKELGNPIDNIGLQAVDFNLDLMTQDIKISMSKLGVNLCL